MIDNSSELSLAAEDEEARTGLGGLASLDSNNDGKVDAGDARFGELRVWVDANGDGISQGGELKRLSDMSVESISLRSVAREDSGKVGSNFVIATSTFTRTDGSTGTVGDALLAYSPGNGERPLPGNSGFVEGILQTWHERLENRNVDESLLERLRSGLGEDGILGDLDADDIFDRYQQTSARKEPICIMPERDDRPGVDGAAVSGLADARSLDRKDWIPAVDRSAADSSTTDAGTDRLLATMIQDMVSFGARVSGDGEYRGAAKDFVRFDYFA